MVFKSSELERVSKDWNDSKVYEAKEFVLQQ